MFSKIHPLLEWIFKTYRPPPASKLLVQLIMTLTHFAHLADQLHCCGSCGQTLGWPTVLDMTQENLTDKRARLDMIGYDFTTTLWDVVLPFPQPVSQSLIVHIATQAWWYRPPIRSQLKAINGPAGQASYYPPLHKQTGWQPTKTLSHNYITIIGFKMVSRFTGVLAKTWWYVCKNILRPRATFDYLMSLLHDSLASGDIFRMMEVGWVGSRNLPEESA